MSRIFNYETNRIELASEVENAEELISSGKAVELSLPELDQYEREANEIHDTFKKRKEDIKNSENPLFNEDVKKYEIEKLEAEYREKSKEVEEKYLEYRKEQLEKARVRAAQATIDVTEKDRLTAEQFATRANLELASSSDKGVALKRIVDDIALLTDGQRVALQSQILPVLASVDDDKYGIDKRNVITAVQSVKNPDIMAHEVAKQLPHTVLTKQRISDIAAETVRNSHNETSGMDREFYEKHLKGKGSFSR